MTNQECIVKAVKIGRTDLLPVILENIDEYTCRFGSDGSFDEEKWLNKNYDDIRGYYHLDRRNSILRKELVERG